MKKLKLNKTGFAGAEVLSRAQLKKVMGGTGSGWEGGSDTSCATTCDCPNGWTVRSGHEGWGISISPCNDTCIASNKSYVTCGTQTAIRCDNAANYEQHCTKNVFV